MIRFMNNAIVMLLAICGVVLLVLLPVLDYWSSQQKTVDTPKILSGKKGGLLAVVSIVIAIFSCIVGLVFNRVSDTPKIAIGLLFLWVVSLAVLKRK
jgi:hypothetical protein